MRADKTKVSGNNGMLVCSFRCLVQVSSLIKCTRRGRSANKLATVPSQIQGPCMASNMNMPGGCGIAAGELRDGALNLFCL